MRTHRPTRSAEARASAIVKRNRAKVQRYEVLVGNVGTVHSGTDLRAARREYQAYVAGSETYRGRGGGEPVTMLRDGRIYCEFNPNHFTDMEAA